MERVFAGARGRKLTPIAVFCTVILALGIAPLRVFAQMNTGTILGVISDPTGAAIPGASVTITNEGTQIAQKTVTDTSGNYTVPDLIPGVYSVTAEKEGFNRLTRSGITLEVDQKARVDVALQIGSVTQSVEVTGEAPLVQTESATQGQVVNSNQIVGLPLNVRNFAQLVAINVGSVPCPSCLGGYVSGDNPQGISDTNINGIEADGNNWQIDGITDNEAFFSILSVNPSVDAIQEFKVSTNNYSAEFGRAGGGNVQIQIKSGTNQFHGVAFEFLRNSALDASDFFTNLSGGKIPPFRQNQFGANLGGPIIKDRTFFFGDYEGYRSRVGQTELQTIPDESQRVGDFSEAGTPTIYNPFTGLPFPGNQINSTTCVSPCKISPAALAVMALFPAPNVVAPLGQANHEGSNSLAHDVDNFDTRVDHRISDKDNFFARYSFLYTTLLNPPFLGTTVGGDPYLASTAKTRNQNVAISDIHSFSPRTLNEFRFGIDRVRTDWTSLDINLTTSDQVGIPGINSFCGFCGGLTHFNVTGLSDFGHTPYAPTFRHDTIFQWVDNVTFIRGRNTFKVGADIRDVRAALFQVDNPLGEFDFDPRFTAEPGSGGLTGGYGMATMLLGYPYYIDRQQNVTYPDARGTQDFFFGQDDIRVNEKLSLQVGARYEIYTAPTDSHHNQSNFDLTTGDMLLACVATSCQAGVKTDLGDWAPRLGIAYSPDHGKTSIRTGAGVSYFSPGYGGQLGTLNDNFPFIQSQVYSASNPLVLNPAVDTTLDEGIGPLAPVTYRPGAPAGHVVPGGLVPSLNLVGVQYVPPDMRLTRVYQWSFDIQRSITPNFLIDAAYVGNAVNHFFNGISINYPAPGALTAADAINPTITLQQLRPYYSLDPNLAESGWSQHGGRTNYNALQVKLEKRLSKGLSVLTSYTYSHTLCRGCAYNDPNHFLADNETQGFDTPQRLTVSYIYRLPFGHRQQYGSTWNKWADGALGGWEVSGITLYETGFPFTPGWASSSLDNGNGNQPNRTCNGKISNWTINEYYNWQCFSEAATNVFGNSGFNILRGPGQRNWDMSLMKNFPMGVESRYLQFRAEAFDLPNNTIFANPNATQCGGTCGEGTITSIATGTHPRQIQFALKLYF
jgi:hypothetical protein